MIIKTPTHYFLVSGASEGFTSLNAFDGALLSAGIGDTNIVKMSSIVPPRCQLISLFLFHQGPWSRRPMHPSRAMSPDKSFHLPWPLPFRKNRIILD